MPFFCFNLLKQFAQRIESEQREADRRKRDFREIEKAVALTKRKFKQETTEVMLGVSVIALYMIYLL